MSTPPPVLPQHCPTPRELDDLELLLSGALAPRDTYDAPGAGPLTLHLPDDLRDRDVELVDPEGLPLARLSADGTLTGLTHPQFGPFRHLYLTPAQARAEHAGRHWVPVTDALTTDDLERVGGLGPVALVALVGTGTPALAPVALLRATVAAAADLPDAVVVAVPLASHGSTAADEVADAALREQVVARYAGDDPVAAVPPRTGEPGLDAHPPAVAAVLTTARPAPDAQGAVLFFTGLSGSGKSTIARALTDRILEQGLRTVTSLDGDVVRRNLSAGLTFSKADRETNIRRIGWVAAEVSRHGGLAVCSPIAPFEKTRQQVRAMVEEAGGRFFLVHVATPLAECERRDRKGLYAKARRGEIPEFTGISSPYEEPADADVAVDTTGRSIDEVVDEVARTLAEVGVVDLPTGGSATGSSAPATATDTPARGSRVQHRASSAAGRLAVVFAGDANVCRSSFMELMTAALVGEGVEVLSGGITTQPGQPMDREIAAFLPEGASGDAFRSQPLPDDLVAAADLILTAEGRQADALADANPGQAHKVFTLGQLAETVRGSDLRGRALLQHAERHRATARPEHDVADPFGRGPEAAKAAAARISELLEVVAPRLVEG